jgi:hypothetical protein
MSPGITMTATARLAMAVRMANGNVFAERNRDLFDFGRLICMARNIGW